MSAADQSRLLARAQLAEAHAELACAIAAIDLGNVAETHLAYQHAGFALGLARPALAQWRESVRREGETER